MLQQKRELIKQQLKETPKASDRQIATMLGVSDKTVGSVRKELESTAEIPQLEKTIGADGKERPRKVKRKTKPAKKQPAAIYSKDAKEMQKAIDTIEAVEDKPELKSKLEKGEITVDTALKAARGCEKIYHVNCFGHFCPTRDYPIHIGSHENHRKPCHFYKLSKTSYPKTSHFQAEYLMRICA